MKGTVGGMIRVLTDHPQYAQLDVSVTVSVQREVVVSPSVLNLNEDTDSAKRLSRYLTVRAPASKPMEILGVDLPDEGMTVDQTKIGPGNYRIKIGNVRSSMDMDGKAIIVHVKSPDGKEKAMRIPVKVRPAVNKAPTG